MIKIVDQTTKQVRSLAEIARKSEALGAKIGANMKKAFSIAEMRVRNVGVTKGQGRKAHRLVQAEKSEQPKLDVEQEGHAELSQMEEPILKTQEPESISPKTEEPSSSTSSLQSRAYYEPAVDCFTCENLIYCDIRSKQSARSVEQSQNVSYCPLAKPVEHK